MHLINELLTLFIAAAYIDLDAERLKKTIIIEEMLLAFKLENIIKLSKK